MPLSSASAASLAAPLVIRFLAALPESESVAGALVALRRDRPDPAPAAAVLAALAASGGAAPELLAVRSLVACWCGLDSAARSLVRSPAAWPRFSRVSRGFAPALAAAAAALGVPVPRLA